jgi:hypothetical protein
LFCFWVFFGGFFFVCLFCFGSQPPKFGALLQHQHYASILYENFSKVEQKGVGANEGNSWLGQKQNLVIY